MSGYNFFFKYCILLSEGLFHIYSVGPVDMPHYGVFHLGCGYLQNYPFRGFPYTKVLNQAALLNTTTCFSGKFRKNLFQSFFTFIWKPGIICQ